MIQSFLSESKLFAYVFFLVYRTGTVKVTTNKHHSIVLIGISVGQQMVEKKHAHLLDETTSPKEDSIHIEKYRTFVTYEGQSNVRGPGKSLK